MTFDIAVSIVAYQNTVEVLSKCIDSVLSCGLKVKVCIVDNSPDDALRAVCKNLRIRYIFNNANMGYGAGHNIAIKQTLQERIKYHLILNPDVYFERGTLEKLYAFMQDNQDVGLVIPKMLYPDGSVQYLCKLLPTPLGLALRRFAPSSKYVDRKNYLYELRFTGYNETMDVPYLSGCFMFIRTEALNKAGLFDERFFMYFEDTDLTRRIHEYYRTVYYPNVSVFHQYAKGSYKSWKLLKYHLWSAVRYFNKWGYFFDKERRDINKKILKKLMAEPDKTGGDESQHI